MQKFKEIAIGVLKKGNQYCLSKRKKDQTFADKWEFPGGKVETNESIKQALVREFSEELAIQTRQWQPLITIPWHYANVSVRLNVYITSDFTGEPIGNEGQEVAWFALNDLLRLDFPAANKGILSALKLSDFYFLTPNHEQVDENIKAIKKALEKNDVTCQLYLPKELTVQQKKDIDILLALAKQRNVQVLLSGYLGHIFSFDGFSGVHLSSQQMLEIVNLNSDILTKLNVNDFLVISTHNQSQIDMALKLEADALLISSVKANSTQEGIETSGWAQITETVGSLPIPVYALGRMTKDALFSVKQLGARGIASTQID